MRPFLRCVNLFFKLIIRVIERIPTIKDLRKRLKQSIEFRMDCGFTMSDRVPSEVSYCRMIKKKKDETPVEHVPKKRGRKPKADREQWLKKQQELEENLPLFEKKVEEQLQYSFEELEKQIPLSPQWGIKKNSEGKNVFWYGFKGHFLVDSKGQYILSSLLSSGNINDGKMAIPLLKALRKNHPYFKPSYVLADAGYDLAPIYQQVRNIGARALIDYNFRNEQIPEGRDKYFRPLCQKGHPYRYDSHDSYYDTLKYTQPKECKECSLKDESKCQKVFKVKVSSDVRKYTVPARGSNSYFELYKMRTSVERVNAYLKEYFQLNNIRHRGSLARVDFEFSILAYTLCKLAVDRLNKSIKNAA